MKKILTVLAAASLLSVGLMGCTLEQGAVAQAGIDRIKIADDTIASTLIQATCGMTVGAFYRLENRNHQRAVALLCGGVKVGELTAEEVALLRHAAGLSSAAGDVTP